jgi:hypothetical protein
MYHGCCSRGGRSSKFRLRRGVGQATHTCNNPHVKCAGVYLHLYVLGLLYRMTLHTEPSDRDVRTRSAASRIDLGTHYVTVCVVSLVAGRGGRGSETMIINAIRWGAWYYTIVLNVCQSYKWSGTFIIKDGRYTLSFCAQTVNNAVTREMYGVLLPRLWIPLLVLTLIIQLHSKLLVTEILLQTANGAQGSWWPQTLLVW